MRQGGSWREGSRRAGARRDRNGIARLIQVGRHEEAFAAIPQLCFPDALTAIMRLVDADWSAPVEFAELAERVLPAARSGTGALVPFLAGAALALPGIASGRPVSGLSFAPDAAILAVALHEHGLQRWGIRPMDLIRYDPVPPSGSSAAAGPCFVHQVVHLADDRVLLTAGRGVGPYRDLVLAAGDDLRYLTRMPGEIAALLRLPGGAGGAVTRHGDVLVHDGDGTRRAPALDLAPGAAPLWGASGSADGQLIATYSQAGASVHDRWSGEAVARIGFLPPIRRRTVSIRPSPQLLPDLTLTVNAGAVRSLDFQPSGEGLLAGMADGAVRLLGPDLSPRGELLPHRNPPAVLASPAGRLLVTAKGGLVRAYPWPPQPWPDRQSRSGRGRQDRGTVRPVELRPGPDAPEGAMALSPVGWLLATAPVDSPGSCQIYLWDLTPVVLSPLMRRPLRSADAEDQATAREAATAARVYRADEATCHIVDALAALLDRYAAPPSPDPIP